MALFSYALMAQSLGTFIGHSHDDDHQEKNELVDDEQKVDNEVVVDDNQEEIAQEQASDDDDEDNEHADHQTVNDPSKNDVYFKGLAIVLFLLQIILPWWPVYEFFTFDQKLLWKFTYNSKMSELTM